MQTTSRHPLGATARALLLALAALAGSAPAQARQPARWADGELLVGLRAGVGPAGRYQLLRDHGANVVDDGGQAIRVVRIRVPALALDAIKRRLERRPEVKFVELNYIFEPVLLPNDTEYPAQWHLPRIQAPQAWDITQGTAAAVLAILDSGVEASHPDLAGKLVAGRNTYANTNDTSDAYGHGTEVAGAAAALTHNATGVAGVAGVAGGAPIMPVRVTDASGRATTASLANGILWAADHGARVVNISFGGVAGNATLRAAAEYAFNHGTLVVAAAGNCGCVDATPENPFILSVAATDESDSPAYFSSIGPYVDLAAPGTNILTTARFGLYTSDSGTSLASPVVAGVAALMFAANPTLTPALAVQMLEATVVDPGGNGYDQSLGYGRINAAAAVGYAATYLAPPDTLAPTVSLQAPLAGASLAGNAVVEVSASDDVGVVRVDLYLDGSLFVSDSASPYSFALDTRTLASGSHVLEAVASDAAHNSASSGPVAVTVANNHAPVAANDSFSAPYRAKASYTAQLLAVLANDTDADANLEVASVKLVGAPNKGGVVKVNANGSLSYTPKQGWRGVESFSYNVKDSTGALSNSASVSVRVP